MRWKFTTVASSQSMSRKEVRTLNPEHVLALTILSLAPLAPATALRKNPVAIYHVVPKSPNQVKLASPTSVTSNHQSNLSIAYSEESIERTHLNWPGSKHHLKRRLVTRSRLHTLTSTRRSCANITREILHALMVTGATTPTASHSSTRLLSRMSSLR